MARNTTVDSHEQKLQTIIHTNHYIRDLVQNNVNEFLALREALLRNSGIQDLTAFKNVLLPLIEGPRIEQLNARITSDKVQLALCGENSSGKTAFLHTFLGIGKILPSGDGPVTARITKLTYAPGEQACIRIRKTLRDQTLNEDEVDLSTFFTGEKPNWMGVGRALSKHIKRPEGINTTSPEFAEWARCFIEIHIPSATLKLGIDVYDTPGFLTDDAPILKETLHDLVELIHPTIVFMYANPTTDDATRGCFLAMKTALYDLDSTSIFFLNSKADVNQMLKFKQGMDVKEFLSVLADERVQRYNLLLRAPFLANDKLEGLPASIDECNCFDLCSVNSQLNKPYGPLMNETTIQRIIQFVANNDLTVAKRICKLVLPIIEAFFNLLHVTSYHTVEQILQLHYDALNWEKICFQAYTIYTEECLKDLFAHIFQSFEKEEQFLVQYFLRKWKLPNSLTKWEVPNSFKLEIQVAACLQVIKPAIRDTLKKFLDYVLEHIASNSDLTRGVVFNEILIGALGRQEISDFAALLLANRVNRRPVNIYKLYMVNTISVPIVQCAQKLQNLDFSKETEIQDLIKNKNESSEVQIDRIVREYLFNMQTIIEKQRDIMLQATRLWGDQQRTVMRSLIDVRYQATSPLLNSHRKTLHYLQRYVWHFIVVECKLRAAQDMAKFSGNIPEIRSESSKSTIFNICTVDWNDEKSLIVKKLSQPLCDQPNAAYYEAHYHLKVANLRHSNIINIRYLYEYRLDNETSELWMIFPPMLSSLEQVLQQSSTSFSLKTVLQWMNDIADALTALHEDELIHRNVVLSNILLSDDERAMLIDLGNWNENCDLGTRHNPSSAVNGMNDDIKGFGEIGQTLCSFIKDDENVSGIINEFNELMFKCSEASHERPVTADFVRNELKFILDMF